MTLAELIEKLEDLRQELGDEAEVRLAFQPSWPLQFTVHGITCSSDLPDWHDGQPAVVYISEGGHPHNDSPYADRSIWDAAQ